MQNQKRYKCIACDVLFREFSLAAALSDNVIKLTFMQQGLHSVGAEKMSKTLQEEIDNTDLTQFDAILLGYGLCGYGVSGLHSELPIVIPRAHECIPIIAGDFDKYSEYFDKNHGTFFLSPGWIERAGFGNEDTESEEIMGIRYNREELLERYGEEMADYIAETLGGLDKNYTKYTFIDTGTGNLEMYEEESKRRAEKKGWDYEKLVSENQIAHKLFAGDWNVHDFLIIPPGAKLKPTYDGTIIGYEF